MAMSQVQSRISQFLTSIRQHPRPIHAAVLAGIVASIVAGRAAWNDYQVYLSYGPGGMPYNVGGWLFTSTIARAISITMFDVRDFERSKDERSWLGSGWPEHPRSGQRPALGPHPIPQRQLDQHSSADIQQKFLKEFRSLADEFSTLVTSKTSKYERHADALWVNDDHPECSLGEGFSREITHIHQNTDYSAHVIVAPKDALKIIQSGWGQLHGWAGVKPFGRKLLPKQYVLLYAPRTEEEVEILLGIVKASIGYMTATEAMMSP